MDGEEEEFAGVSALENYVDAADTEANEEKADSSRIYLPSDLRPPQAVADLGRDIFGVHHIYGYDTSRRNNFQLIEDDRIVYACGASVVFENIITGRREFLLSIAETGVGCVVVHPSRRYLAVGGRGCQPCIYIYSYPDLKVRNVLRGGAERGYSCMSFAATGDKLASVSTAPDYMLTIWDWESEQMGLHSKAFGQDVWNVEFSKDDSHRLTTSGIGHIRFWKMAATFTGLKLQGHIGKFGKIDLSDIDHFVELPDGKVVSGTETGSLLLWEGNFIKCRFVQIGGKSCHDAPITFISFDRVEKCIISASLDGVIRWWDFTAIDTAEVDSDQTMDFELLPLASFTMSNGLGIKSMIDSGNVGARRLFVIMDTDGKAQTISFSQAKEGEESSKSPRQHNESLRLCDMIISLQEAKQAREYQAEQADSDKTAEEAASIADGEVGGEDEGSANAAQPSTPVKQRSLGSIDAATSECDGIKFSYDNHTFGEFHLGAITGLDTCPLDHLAAICGSDGVVRVIDYNKRKTVALRKFSTAATSLKWMNTNLDSNGKSFAVGFHDGTVRILTLGKSAEGDDVLLRRLVFKPHNAPVIDISFSDSGYYIATAGKDGIVFFQKCKPLLEEKVVWDPMRFVSVSAMAPNSKNPVYCERVAWSPEARTALFNCSDLVLREVDLSLLLGGAEEGDEENKEDKKMTFEIVLPYREIATTINVLGGSKSGVFTIAKEAAEDLTSSASHEAFGGEPTATTTATNGGEEDSSPQSPTRAKTGSPSPMNSPSKGKHGKDQPTDQINKLPLKLNNAIYVLSRREGQYISGASLNANQHLLCESPLAVDGTLTDHMMGLYAHDAKEFAKTPTIAAMKYTWTKRYLLVGLADGTVSLRPNKYLEVFGRAAAHNGATGGASLVAASFDDRFLLSAGRDGCLVVNRVRLDLITIRAESLFKDLDAGVFGRNVVKPATARQNQLELEPSYLTFVAQDRESEDEKLFNQARLSAPKELNVLDIDPFIPAEEIGDLAPNAYSIQDNQLKLEEDAKKVAADALKGRIRSSIRALRKDYEKVIKENETIPEKVRLSIEELTVDGEFFAMLEAQGVEMLEEVHRECAYDAELIEKRYLKLKKRLMEGLLMEEMSLAAFDLNEFHKVNSKASGRAAPSGRVSRSVVWSLRTSAVHPEVSRLIAQIKSDVRQAELRDSQQKSADVAQRKAAEAMDEMKQRLQKKDEANPESSAAQGHQAAEESESSADLRRIKRKARKDELEMHLKEKPSENDDDERDIQAIKNAERSIGDYKLKCSDEYEVPEEQRINAPKKMRQMAMLEDTMLMLRVQFNERFLALRSLKREMTFSVRRCNARIREIDRELDQESLSVSLWQPTLSPDEFPDDAEEVTKAELEEYIASSEGKPWEQTQAPKHRVITGNKLGVMNKKGATEVVRKSLSFAPVSVDRSQLSGFLSDERLVDYTPSRSDPLKYFEVNECLLSSGLPDKTSSEQMAQLQRLEANVPVLAHAKSLLKVRMQVANPSKTQETLTSQRRQALLFERSMTLKQIEDDIVSFSEAVSQLRVDRHRVISDLKLAEFKLLSLFQEYKLLLTFEGKDNTLQQKQVRCKSEEREISTLSSDNKTRLDGKLEEIKAWNEKLVQITAEFKGILPDNHPYVDTLTKIFRKKIKRSKGGDEDNEEEDEDEEEDGDDEDEDDEEVEDICPPGCDQNLFEKILELREKKLDTEEVSSELQKGIDDLKKTADRLKQREKQIVKESQQTEYEVQQFQLQKQAALNQIRVIVPLRIDQIFSFESSGVLTGPTDKPVSENLESDPRFGEIKNPHLRQLVSRIGMKSHTLFSTQSLDRLKERINELHNEIDEAKEGFKLLHKERTQLIKDRDLKESETKSWQDRCLDLQMLKFGREMDLDELEASSDRTKEREMEAVLAEEREKFETEATKLARELQTAKETYIKVTKDNTQLLNEITRLTEMKISITHELNAPGQNVAPGSLVEDARDIEERNRIKAYTKFQTTELESLRAELNMLKRKEAPIFSYSSPPVPPMAMLGSVSADLSGKRSGGEGLILPPIPNNKKRTAGR